MKSTQQLSPPASIHPPSLLQALSRVLDRGGFPQGSNDVLFRDAQFGRDALEVAEDLLTFRPEIARVVIRCLAFLQGASFDRLTEEEPGKIHHEYRALVMDGHPVHPESAAILRGLSEFAGFSPDAAEYISYATIDATPLYVRLVSRYCRLYGDAILQRTYTPRGWTAEGAHPQIEQSVGRAVDWIAHHLQQSDLGLLEFQRLTPHSHRFQAWKDGGTSYLHPNGQFANYNAPIASIEVQGLAYDALVEGSQILKLPASERDELLSLAGKLQHSVLERFWMPEEKYFAMAIDRDPATGDPRQVRLIASNPGALLDSGIFDNLPEDQRRYYVGAIVRRIYGDEFITQVGVRSTSLVHQKLQDYPGYQSSYTVWPKETYDVAKGMEKQGFPRLGADLENRLLNTINLSGSPAEFFYMTADGRVAYHPEAGPANDGAEEIDGTNVPEADQAWTISAGLAIKAKHGRPAHSPPSTATWQAKLETDLARQIPPVELLRSRAELALAYTRDRFRVDTAKGWKHEKRFVAEHRLSPDG